MVFLEIILHKSKVVQVRFFYFFGIVVDVPCVEKGIEGHEGFKRSNLMVTLMDVHILSHP